MNRVFNVLTTVCISTVFSLSAEARLPGKADSIAKESRNDIRSSDINDPFRKCIDDKVAAGMLLSQAMEACRGLIIILPRGLIGSIENHQEEKKIDTAEVSQ